MSNSTAPAIPPRLINFEIQYTLVDWDQMFDSKFKIKELQVPSIKEGLLAACKHLAQVATRLKRRQFCVIQIHARKSDGSLWTNRMWRPRHQARMNPNLFGKLSPARILVRGYGPEALRQIEKPVSKRRLKKERSFPTA